MLFNDVLSYINENIFHSDSFDALSEVKKQKAMKQAEQGLYLLFKNYNPSTKPLPVEAIAYQTLWIVAKDSSIQKAELGLASQSIEGMTISFTKVDRTVAPEVKRILSKRVGSYNVATSDTRRGAYR